MSATIAEPRPAGHCTADNPPVRRFTVAEYHRMLDAGILYEGEPVELLEGLIVKKSDRPDPHVGEGFGSIPWSWLRSFSRREYHRMLDAGILYEGEPVELLFGQVVRKAMRHPPHDVCIQRLTTRFVWLAPDGWQPRIQLAAVLGEAEPEPDALLARGDEATFADHHPDGSDIGLVVEVSDSSLATDRLVKLPLYAAAGIPVY